MDRRKPLQNRVDPYSRIHAVSARGMFMGNRGILHSHDRTLVTDRWKTQAWIICTTEVLPGRTRRHLMAPGKYTELFFLDELTALAAGHRPCAECRHKAWMSYRNAIALAQGLGSPPMAGDITRKLHGEMREYLKKYGSAARPGVEPSTLPDGAMFSSNGAPHVKWRGRAYPWSFSGYGKPVALPTSGIRLTPELNCLALAGGYETETHSSLQD